MAVAKTQLGYQESQNNFQAAEDNQTKKGWTRYGAWYGNPYGDWDAMFASFCLNYAKVPNYTLSDDTAKWVEKLSEQSLYVTAEGASEGCLVFLDKNDDKTADHVGILEEIKDGDVKEIKVIEGDMNDVVQSNTYQIDDPRITGFGKLPAKLDENAAISKTVECGDYTITVTYDSSAEIPESAVLQAYDLTYTITEEEMAGLAKEGENLNGLFKLDVGFYVNGVEIEPAKGSAVDVKIVKNGGFGIEDSQQVDIYHFKKDGTTEILSSQTGSENEEKSVDSVKFQTESFSEIMGVTNAGPSKGSSGDDNSGSDPANTPMLAAAGDTSGSTRSAASEVPRPAYSKYIKDNKDGTYDLTLNVKGAQTSETHKAKVDIILVLDVSDSMNDSVATTEEHPELDTRIKLLKYETKKLFTDLTASNSQIDPQFQVVSYSYEAVRNTSSWITASQQSVFNNTIDNLATSKGTNYQDALYETTQVGDGRSDAVRVVLFISDGSPSASTVTTSTSTNYAISKNQNSNYYKLYNGGIPFGQNLGKQDWGTVYYSSNYGGGNTSYNSPNEKTRRVHLDGARMAAAEIDSPYFFAVGLGTEGQKNYVVYNKTGQQAGTITYTPKQVLEQVANSTNSTYKEVHEVKDTQEGLSEFFDKFKEKITEINVTHVGIEDTLSDWADFESSQAEVTLTVYDPEGAVAKTATGTISNPPSVTMQQKNAQGVMENKVISVSVNQSDQSFKVNFPQDYKLEKNYVYEVKVKIKPSEKAYTDYINNGGYGTMKGDPNTDDPSIPAAEQTSSNKPGFNSNMLATLEYQVDGYSEVVVENYPDPVLQVKPVVDFKIQKTKEDGTTDLSGAQFALYKKVGNNKQYYSVNSTTGEVEWVNTPTNLPYVGSDTTKFKADNLPDGEYFVKETAAPDGYYPLDTELKVTVANGTLSITKVKDGSAIVPGKQTSVPHIIYTANVSNSTGYELPDTGGSGTNTVTMIGLLLLGFGLVYGIFLRRKSEGGIG